MLKSNTFVKSVAVLFTGTVLSQVVTYLLAPIITRQFGPADSAYLGLFLRITTLGAALATVRLELAFPLEKEDHHAFGIYRFSMRFSIFLSVIALLFLGIYSWVDFSSLKDLLFLMSLPVGIFLMAFYNQGNSWALRKEKFKVIARSALALSLVTNVLKVLFGFFSHSFLFLIGATIVGYLFSSIAYFFDFKKNKKTAILKYNSKRTKALIGKNSDLIKYNLPHVFVDLGRDLLMVSIIWNLYGKIEYGSYDHAFRMLKLPVIFIGSAIGQVFFRQCTDLIHQNKSVFPLAAKVVLILAGLSIVPFSIIAIWGRELFAFVFGVQWTQSGEMATVMVPWLMMNFLASPISFIAILMKRQQSFFWINLLGTLGLIFVVSLPYIAAMHYSFYEILKLLSMSQSIFLLIVLIWMLIVAKNNKISSIN